jgi:hypothetical protein
MVYGMVCLAATIIVDAAVDTQIRRGSKGEDRDIIYSGPLFLEPAVKYLNLQPLLEKRRPLKPPHHCIIKFHISFTYSFTVNRLAVPFIFIFHQVK